MKSLETAEIADTKRKGREIQEKRGIAHDGGSKMKEEGIMGDDGKRNG